MGELHVHDAALPCTSSTHRPPATKLTEMSNKNGLYWISQFTLQVRKMAHTCTIHSTCRCVDYSTVYSTTPKLIAGALPFYGVYQTLNAEMKRLKSLGLGLVKKQVTEDGNKALWAKEPHVLVDTLTYMYMCGLYFALSNQSGIRKCKHLCAISL